ncbi:hypothetical protein ES703_101756 [subsurface metagenome]
MEAPWKKPFKDREEARAALGPMGLMAHICWWLGIVFVILGIIAGAMNATLGLESIVWLLLAIAAFLAGLMPWLAWAVALHLLGVEGKSKEKE